MNWDRNTVLMTTYIVISIATIITLIVLLSNKKCNDTENYDKCICTQKSGGRGRYCQNTEETVRAYNNGVTEFTDFAGIQRANGGPKWDEVSPGNYNFPVSQGCPWN